MKKKAAKRVKKTAPPKARRKPSKAPKRAAAKAVAPVEKLAAVPAAAICGNRPLPPRQQQFVAEYLANGMNGTRAAITVGYSAKTAESQASRMLINVKVAAALAEAAGRQLVKREITAERVLDEIAKLAFFDPRKLFTKAGDLVPIHELDDETAMAIAGVDVSEIFAADTVIGHVKKIKIADKGSNLERLGRYFKLFTDKVVHSFDLSDLSDEELKERLAKLGWKG